MTDRLCRLLLALCLLFPTPLATQERAPRPDDRLWLLWETLDPAGACVAEGCRNYTTRLVAEGADAGILGLIGALDARALRQGRPPLHPDAPRICQHHDPTLILGFDPEALELADKAAVLRDLPGVHFNLTGLTAPAGYGGDFGGTLHSAFETRFRAAGIPLLSKEAVATTPGHPILNVYFSNTRGDCDYSVFASLSQTVLLTRAPDIKISAGTWAAMERHSDDFPDATEFDAILRIADAFVADWQRANPP